MRRPASRAAPLCGFALLFLAGCASVAPPAIVGGAGPVALVALRSNDDINWEGEDETQDSKAADWVRGLFVKDDSLVTKSSAAGILAEADALIREHMASPGVTFVDRDAVLNAPAYQTAPEQSALFRQHTLSAEGYRFVWYRGAGFDAERCAALCAETGAGALLFVDLAFTKAMTSGFGKNGQCRARVIMSLVALDAAGKVIFRRGYEERSYNRAAVKGGAYAPGALSDLCREALITACARFARQAQ
ncbi:MAG: hypothetical protein LBR16_08130 [Treponema sp.]|jgi:hypothetical protein|nr:hypothetical protein [Treponema sp.]